VSETAQSLVLVVDDDPDVLFTVEAILEDAGHKTVALSSGREALERLGDGRCDAVVSDIRMPDLDGIQLLRALRERGLELPVILMTGGPDIETAIQAVELGALRYLVKPIAAGALQEAVEKAVRLNRLAQWKREASSYLGLADRGLGDRAALEAAFRRALASLWLAGQPIVQAADGALFGVEALIRSGDASLMDPGALFDAAERLRAVHELSRAIRVLAGSAQVPPGVLLFVNLHAADLHDEQLLSAKAPLSGRAAAVILEITEKARLDHVADLRARIRDLRSLGYRIAVDDLGAGYAGLSSFAALEPDVVKLDMSLVRDVDHDRVKRRLIESMTQLGRELGVLVVAEGIETEAERAVLRDIGCDLLQGYVVGHPQPLAGADGHATAPSGDAGAALSYAEAGEGAVPVEG
jgi:EAL domain-containing protein (putative c-di-GMP-specific phosphodiesterase class I)/CheY-like chemotaxis protein